MSALVTRPKTATIMLVLLSVSVFIHNLGLGLYYTNGLEPHPTFEFLHTAIFLCGVVWWLRAEARRSAVVPVYCAGLLVSFGWLIIIPYHLFKTRGLSGLVPLAVLSGSFILAYVFAAIAYVIFSL
jgi:hypothetical protein